MQGATIRNDKKIDLTPLYSLFLFTLFLMVGETAKIFYSNGFWEPNEQSIEERVEVGEVGGCKELQLGMLRK